MPFHRALKEEGRNKTGAFGPCFILLFLVFVQLEVHSKADPTEEDLKRMIVVDVGSTGTRVHLFQIESIGNVKQIGDYFEVKPGLVSLLNTTEGTLSNVIQNISEKIWDEFQEKDKKRRIYVAATGSMRLISSKERDSLIESIKMGLKTTNVRVLSGEEEAAFGVLGMLTQPPGALPIDAFRYGWLDLGGFSTEIGWVTDGFIPEHLFPLPPVLAPFRDARIFGRSFLDVGWQLIRQAKASYLQEHSIEKDPCKTSLKECQDLMIILLDYPSWFQFHQPELVPDNFIAVNGFSYVILDKQKMQPNSSLDDILKRAEEVCLKGVEEDCLDLTFIYTLLNDMFQLNSKKFFWISKQVVTNQTLSWPRGFAVYTNWEMISHQLISLAPPLPFEKIFATLILVSSILCITALFGIFFWFKKSSPRKFRNPNNHLEMAKTDDEVLPLVKP
jgi:hypothetical protein